MYSTSSSSESSDTKSFATIELESRDEVNPVAKEESRGDEEVFVSSDFGCCVAAQHSEQRQRADADARRGRGQRQRQVQTLAEEQHTPCELWVCGETMGETGRRGAEEARGRNL